jgi:hypothetical protein
MALGRVWRPVFTGSLDATRGDAGVPKRRFDELATSDATGVTSSVAARVLCWDRLFSSSVALSFSRGGVMTDYVLYVRVEVVHTNRIGDTPMRAVAGAEMPVGVSVSEQQKKRVAKRRKSRLLPLQIRVDAAGPVTPGE